MSGCRFCPHCGAATETDDAFCARCGGQLDGGAKREAPALWAGPAAAKRVEAPARPQPARSDPDLPPARPRHGWRRRHSVIAIALILLVAGAVVGNTLLQNRRDEQAVRTAVEQWLADVRDTGDAAYLAETVSLPLEDEEPSVALARFGEVTLGDVSEHEARATVPTVMALAARLPARYESQDMQIRSVWRLRLTGDKEQRSWQVEQVTREGDFTTEPAMLPEPSDADITAAREVAEQAIVAGFTYDAKQELTEYNERQPDVYLTAPVEEAEAQRLATDGADATVPPFLIERTQLFSEETELYGVAFEDAQALVTQSMEYCSGDRTLRRVRARVDGWRPDAVESGTLAALQRVLLTGTLQLDGETTCRSTDYFTGDVSSEREKGSGSVAVQVTLVRPHLKGVDESWRVQRLSSGDSGFNTVYATDE